MHIIIISYIYIYIYIYAYIYVYTHIHTYIPTYNIHTHIHTYIHTHTYIHAYIHTQVLHNIMAFSEDRKRKSAMGARIPQIDQLALLRPKTAMYADSCDSERSYIRPHSVI